MRETVNADIACRVADAASPDDRKKPQNKAAIGPSTCPGRPPGLYAPQRAEIGPKMGPDRYFRLYFRPSQCRQPGRVLPSGELRSLRTAGDPDTTACCPLPGYAPRETPPIWSRLRRPRGFPRWYAKHTAYDLQLRDL